MRDVFEKWTNFLDESSEDNASGKLTDKRFEILSGDYENEQVELELENTHLQVELEGFDADSVRADKFIEIVKRYMSFTELTTPKLNEFVEKIIVHEPDKSTGERVQQVDISLNFIGKFEVPMPEPKPEEIAEMEMCRLHLAHFDCYQSKRDIIVKQVLKEGARAIYLDAQGYIRCGY